MGAKGKIQYNKIYLQLLTNTDFLTHLEDDQFNLLVWLLLSLLSLFSYSKAINFHALAISI